MTLSAQGNTELLKQFKTGFKRAINWNKYQSEPTLKIFKWYLNYFDPSFQGGNRLFDFNYFKSYKMIAINIGKQQVLDACNTTN